MKIFTALDILVFLYFNWFSGFLIVETATLIVVPYGFESRVSTDEKSGISSQH